MKLLRIELSNLRQYKKQEILFPQKGLIGIRGDNGAGKSTLFNVISWAFYGKYEGVKNSQLRRQGSTTRSPSHAVIDFLYEDDFYRVKRSLSSSPTQNFVQCNGITRAVGTTNLNDFIENDLFKMDHKAFTACYYAAQDDFDALAKLNPGPRVSMLSKLLRIDSIDDASEQVRKDKRVLEIELDEAKKHLKNETELTEQLSSFKINEKAITKQMNDLTKQMKSIHKQLDSLRLQKEKSDKLANLYQQFTSAISNLETKKQTLTESSLRTTQQQLFTLEKKKSRLDEIAPQKDHYFSLLKKKDDLNTEKEQYVAIYNLNKKKKETEDALQNYATSFEATKNNLANYDDLDEKYQKSTESMSALELKIGEMRDNLQELTTTVKWNKTELVNKQEEFTTFSNLGTGAPCPCCKQPLSQEHFEQELSTFNTKIITLQKEISELEEKQKVVLDNGKKGVAILEQQKSLLQDLLRQKNEKSALLSRVDSISQEKEKQEHILTNILKERQSLPANLSFNPNNYKSLINEINALQPVYEEIIQLENVVKEIPQVKQNIVSLEEQINTLTSNINEAKKRVDALKFDQVAHLTLANEIESVRLTSDELKDSQYGLQNKSTMITTHIAQIEEALKENEIKKAALKDKMTDILDLTKLDSLFKTYKTDKLSKLAPTLSDLMSDMIDTLTDGKYDRVELDDSYNIFIYREGEKMPLDIFSGGEKKLAALCQRIAISQLLVSQTDQAKFDMLALDEVFGAMDSKRQDSLINMFRNLNDMFSQILIVAHNEYVKDLFEHTLHIELNNDKTSIAKWITDDYGKSTWDVDEVQALLDKHFDTNNEEEEEPVTV